MYQTQYWVLGPRSCIIFSVQYRTKTYNVFKKEKIMITAFTSQHDSCKLVVTKCTLSFPCFSLLSSWDHDIGIVHREHMEKVAHWACKRANDLIYKGAFKQQSNLDWLYSTFSISSSGHILAPFMSRETDKIKDKRKVERPRLVRRPLTLEGPGLRWLPWGHGVRNSTWWRWRGSKVVSEVILPPFLSIPRASSLHHPKASD